MGELGMFSLRVPKEYGGLGMGWTAEAAALCEIGPLGMVLGCQFSMPSIVGIEPFSMYQPMVLAYLNPAISLKISPPMLESSQ